MARALRFLGRWLLPALACGWVALAMYLCWLPTRFPFSLVAIGDAGSGEGMLQGAEFVARGWPVPWAEEYRHTTEFYDIASGAFVRTEYSEPSHFRTNPLVPVAVLLLAVGGPKVVRDEFARRRRRTDQGTPPPGRGVRVVRAGMAGAVIASAAAAAEIETAAVAVDALYMRPGRPPIERRREFELGYGPALVTEHQVIRLRGGDPYGPWAGGGTFAGGAVMPVIGDPFVSNWPEVAKKRKAAWKVRKAWAARCPAGWFTGPWRWLADPWAFRRWLTAAAGVVGLGAGCFLFRPWRGARGAHGASGPGV